MKSNWNVVGIMNGTSIDGVDFVLCQAIKLRGKFKFKYRDQAHVKFPEKLRNHLLSAAQGKLNSWETAQAHYELGRFYSSALKKIKTRKKWKIDLVGLHGQTIYHEGTKATFQIGEPSFMSADLNIPCVSDFRSMDIALGGEGAPLATFFHKQILGELAKCRRFAVQNLGGIGNVSFFNGRVEISFDTGPANMLIDALVEQITHGSESYDKNGVRASHGIPDVELVNSWLKQKVFKKRPPKSLGREDFGDKFLTQCVRDMKELSEEDQLATLVELSAASIERAYRDFLPQLPNKVFLCGGGAKNDYLKFRIQYRLPEVEVLTTDELGWPVDAIEGAAFALMAVHRLFGMVNHLPKTTGAKKSLSLGKVSSQF